MAQTTGTFRIFVSSTFSDLKDERNALPRTVFPRMRELCRSHGCRFQAIDLRWRPLPAAIPIREFDEIERLTVTEDDRQLLQRCTRCSRGVATSLSMKCGNAKPSARRALETFPA